MSQGFTFDASFGGVRIDVTSTNITHGRKRVNHGHAKKDGVTQEDQGREPLVCDLEFVFVDRKPMDGEITVSPFAERFTEFDALVSGSAVRRLVHPYLGAILCGISGFTHRADAEGGPAIFCSATFTEENSLPFVFEAGAGIHALAGAQEVRASVHATQEALEELGLPESPNLAIAVAASEDWQSNPRTTTRQIQHEMSILNSRLSKELSDFEAAGDIDSYPIIREYTKLQYNLRRAAEGATASTKRIVNITTTHSVPLRIVAARFYGASQAAARFAEMLELNPGLRNPGLIEANVTLKAYAAA